MAAKIWGSHGKSNDDDGKYRLCSSKSPKDKQNKEVVQKLAWNGQEIGLEECFFLIFVPSFQIIVIKEVNNRARYSQFES